MREFFNPLRRKIGVVTLVMACVFMEAWMRSFGTADFLGSQTSCFKSFKGSIFCVTILDPMEFKCSYNLLEPNATGISDEYNDPNMLRFWHWRFVGFAYGTQITVLRRENGSGSMVTLFRLIVPYWSIVLSLTLISLWLLPSKPRQSASKKNAETTASEGAAT